MFSSLCESETKKHKVKEGEVGKPLHLECVAADRAGPALIRARQWRRAALAPDPSAASGRWCGQWRNWAERKRAGIKWGLEKRGSVCGVNRSVRGGWAAGSGTFRAEKPLSHSLVSNEGWGGVQGQTRDSNKGSGRPGTVCFYF